MSTVTRQVCIGTARSGSGEVAYPLEVDSRATTGALLGPDCDQRDQLLTGLCQGVVDLGGLVWVVEAWRHVAPPPLRELSAVDFVVPDSGVPDEFGLLELLIEERHAAHASDESSHAPVLVVVFEADEVLVLRRRMAPDVRRLIRRGARVGVGFVMVAPTERFCSDRVIEDLALDSGACVVLGAASASVHEGLWLRHKFRPRPERAPGSGYVVSARSQAVSFDFPSPAFTSPSEAGGSSAAGAPGAGWVSEPGGPGLVEDEGVPNGGAW
ncbi:MAG: hypothetical protein ACRCYX_12500 [Dermatophilaceae bacterium]